MGTRSAPSARPGRPGRRGENGSGRAAVRPCSPRARSCFPGDRVVGRAPSSPPWRRPRPRHRRCRPGRSADGAAAAVGAGRQNEPGPSAVAAARPGSTVAIVGASHGVIAFRAQISSAASAGTAVSLGRGSTSLSFSPTSSTAASPWAGVRLRDDPRRGLSMLSGHGRTAGREVAAAGRGRGDGRTRRRGRRPFTDRVGVGCRSCRAATR